MLTNEQLAAADKCFTVVFAGDVRDFKQNPLHIVSEFGHVVGVTADDLQERVAKQDAIIQQQRDVMRMARDGIRTVIEQGVQVTEGPYKQHKNNKCVHGQWGYEGCEACVSDYLAPILAALDAALKGSE